MYGHSHDHGEFQGPHSMHGGQERGRGGRGRQFEPHDRPFDGFDRPYPHDRTDAQRRHFGDGGGRGDNSMPGNNRGPRGGGPQGRGPQEFGFGRGPGRGGRPLEQGDLRWLVLDLIGAQPRHGYEIIKAIEELLNGHYTPSPGVIYPTLTYLEETGLIASEAQATKKLYSLTDEGRSALTANAAEIQATRARMEAARARFGSHPAPEMMRAMENLRTAISIRLSKGELSRESLAAVTAALDRAASEIERS